VGWVRVGVRVRVRVVSIRGKYWDRVRFVDRVRVVGVRDKWRVRVGMS